jgi:hypothetical protein
VDFPSEKLKSAVKTTSVWVPSKFSMDFLLRRSQKRSEKPSKIFKSFSLEKSSKAQ